MPISQDELRRGRAFDSLTDRVFAFLEENRGTAFTAEEVAVAVGHVTAEAPQQMVPAIARGLAVGTVQAMLNGWAQNRTVEARGVQDSRGIVQMYYASK